MRVKNRLDPQQKPLCFAVTVRRYEMKIAVLKFGLIDIYFFLKVEKNSWKISCQFSLIYYDEKYKQVSYNNWTEISLNRGLSKVKLMNYRQFIFWKFQWRWMRKLINKTMLFILWVVPDIGQNETFKSIKCIFWNDKNFKI